VLKLTIFQVEFRRQFERSSADKRINVRFNLRICDGEITPP